MSTQELINQAQERQYTEFDAKAKEMLQAKVAAALVAKGYKSKLSIAKNESAKELDESKEEYKKVFAAELAKFDAKSPADLSDEDKKKFFDAIDAAYEGKNEKPEAGDK